MKKWYKESYFDSKAWIIENFEKLNITNDETLLVLLIDFYNKNKTAINYELLTKKLKKNQKEIDKLIASLVEKHYLKLKTNSKGIVFDIDNIFEFDPTVYDIANNQNLYDTLGDLFGKPLTPNELAKLNDLLNNYTETQILEATRIAEAKKKLNLAYIEGILRNEK